MYWKYIYAVLIVVAMIIGYRLYDLIFKFYIGDFKFEKKDGQQTISGNIQLRASQRFRAEYQAKFASGKVQYVIVDGAFDKPRKGKAIKGRFDSLTIVDFVDGNAFIGQRPEAVTVLQAGDPAGQEYNPNINFLGKNDVVMALPAVDNNLKLLPTHHFKQTNLRKYQREMLDKSGQTK